MNSVWLRYLPECVFIVVFLGLLYAWFAWESEQERRRLKRRLGISRPGGGGSFKIMARHLSRRVWKYFAPGSEAEIEKIRRQLMWAGFRDPSALYVYGGLRAGAVLLCAAGVGAWLFLTPAPHPLHMGGAAIAAFFVVRSPGIWLRRQVEIRHQRIFRELPDTLDMLMVCLEAGLGFEAALLRVSRELEGLAPILSREFALYFFETRGGLSRRQGLEHLKDRNGSDPLRGVVDVMLQSLRFGTDIISALDVHAGGMRTKRQQLAEEKAAKIAPKLVLPLIGLILPALMIIVLGPAVVNLSRHFLE